MRSIWIFFFFQAEDGIRDVAVTGVQTCAFRSPVRVEAPVAIQVQVEAKFGGAAREIGDDKDRRGRGGEQDDLVQIGRASWRGRVEILVGAGSFKKKKRLFGTCYIYI